MFTEGARVTEFAKELPQTKLVEQGKVRISTPTIRKPRRRMFRRLPFGAVPGYAPLCLDSNDPLTVECGAKKRTLRDVPLPDGALLNQFKEFVAGEVKKLPSVLPLDFEDWLASTSYNEERKEQLREQHRLLRGGRPSRKISSHIDTFIKSEFYPTWKFPRHINSRHDAFKAFSGPAFKAVENVVYHLVPAFIKHVPVPERPAAILELKRHGRHYYQTDFEAFESHFDPKLMNICECALYRHVLKNFKHIDFICDVITGINKMRTRTGFRAEVKGRRMSGDMCTSLGNGWTNYMLAKFLCHLQNKELYGFVEGDDGLFSTEAVLTKELYARLGFTIKLEEIPDPTIGSFCGMIFTEHGEILRDPRRFLQGFGWTLSFLYAGESIQSELLRAKALSALYETPQCPIVAPMAWKALELTNGAKPRFIEDGYHEYKRIDVSALEPFHPSPEIRQLMFQLFGCTIDQQLAVEAAIARGDMDKVAELLPAPLDVQDFARKYVIVT